MQRGQYPHNTGVKANNPPNGGFETFYALGRYESTYATWLGRLAAVVRRRGSSQPTGNILGRVPAFFVPPAF
jgi:hypothetical protein